MAQIQRTLILVKPDALQRDLVGEIVHRFELKGLKIVGMKMIKLGDTVLDTHYAHIADKPFFPGLKEFMMSAPVVAMVLEGMEAVSAVRLIVGATRGYEADAGSIRGDMSSTVASNLVHASDTLENAVAEIDRFFDPKDIFEYEKITDRLFND